MISLQTFFHKLNTSIKKIFKLPNHKQHGNNLSSHTKSNNQKSITHNEFEDHLHTITSNGTSQIEYGQTDKRPTTSIIAFWIIGALVCYAGYVAYQGLDVIYMILTALILSIAMESSILFFSKRTKRGRAISISYLMLLCFLLLGILIIIPFILKQSEVIRGFIKQRIIQGQQLLQQYTLIDIIQSRSRLPDLLKQPLIQYLSNPELLHQIQQTITQNMQNITNFATGSANTVKNIGLTLVNGFFGFLVNSSLVFILAILLSSEKRDVAYLLSHLGGKHHQKQYYKKVSTLYDKMGTRLNSQFLLCLIIGLVSRLGLTIVGRFGLALPNTASLALMAGLTEFIPYAGPILGAIPAILVATIAFGRKGLITISLLYLIIQQLENNILVPIVMKKALGISPSLIFICMMLGGVALGFLGIVLAVPITVIITVLTNKGNKK